MLSVKCPHCDHMLSIPERYAGQCGRCNHCGNRITVPNTPAVAPEPQPPTAPRPERPVPARHPRQKRRARKEKPFQMPSTLTAVDVETTGFWAGQHKIIEIGAVRFTPKGQRIGVFQKLANPGFSIPREATAISNITDDMVAGAAPPTAVIREFVDWCGPEALFVAHNAIFDADFLVVTLSAAGIPIPKNWYIVDSLNWIRKSTLVTLDNYKLGTIADALRIREDQQHRALSDACVVANLTRLLLAHDDGQVPLPKRAERLTTLAAKKATDTQRRYLRKIGAPAHLIETADRVAVGRLTAAFDKPHQKEPQHKPVKVWRIERGGTEIEVQPMAPARKFGSTVVARPPIPGWKEVATKAQTTAVLMLPLGCLVLLFIAALTGLVFLFALVW